MAIDQKLTQDSLFGNIKAVLPGKINGCTINTVEMSDTVKKQIEDMITKKPEAKEQTKIKEIEKTELSDKNSPKPSVKANQESGEEKETHFTKSKESEQIPKHLSLDKVTVLLTSEQKEGLDRVAKKIMKSRPRDSKGKDSKERITANTLIRALIENFLKHENSSQIEALYSEDEVHKWIGSLFK